MKLFKAHYDALSLWNLHWELIKCTKFFKCAEIFWIEEFYWKTQQTHRKRIGIQHRVTNEINSWQWSYFDEWLNFFLRIDKTQMSLNFVLQESIVQMAFVGFCRKKFQIEREISRIYRKLFNCTEFMVAELSHWEGFLKKIRKRKKNFCYSLFLVQWP